jgi:hypothetical protein
MLILVRVLVLFMTFELLNGSESSGQMDQATKFDRTISGNSKESETKRVACRAK